MTTQTDRELLELAALAADIDLSETNTTPWREGYKDWWDPLEDDGDAFRLAVKLRMLVSTRKQYAHARVVGTARNRPHLEEYTPERDPYAATRRAIVRAAAAIGEQMEKDNG